MRLGEAVIGSGAKRVCMRMAILMIVGSTVLSANAQSASGTNASQKKSSRSESSQSRLKVSAAEMKLLGAPSNPDSDYLSQLGGPADDVGAPTQSLAEEPATPTEVLLAKGGATGVTASTTGNASAAHTFPSASAALSNADLASRGVAASPYGLLSTGATLYRSPW